MPYLLARIYAGLGKNDDALDCLEKSYQTKAPWMACLKVDPRMDNLRSNPRFRDLMRRMKFPD
jgi:hypothetical protein